MSMIRTLPALHLATDSFGTSAALEFDSFESYLGSHSNHDDPDADDEDEDDSDPN